MARFTSAYSDFKSGLEEVNSLRRIAASKERVNPMALRHEINAVCRGAIVLLSANVEAYVKSLGELALEGLFSSAFGRDRIDNAVFFHVSKDLLDEITMANKPRNVAGRVFAFLHSDSELWSKSGPFPRPIPTDRFNKGFSNPAFNKVKRYFNRFGYSAYQKDLARRLKRDFVTTTNRLDYLVHSRNKIAHGDSTVTMTPHDIADTIRIIRKFGMETDGAFANWCKAHLCGIRSSA